MEGEAFSLFLLIIFNIVLMMMYSYQDTPNLVFPLLVNIMFYSTFESGNKLYTKAMNAVNG